MTGEALRKARVVLDGSNVRLTAEADSSGAFQFFDLPPGTYRLSASRAGFLEHPAKRPVVLGAAGSVSDAEIGLPPQGIIGGRVVDEEGDPFPDAAVVIFKQVFQNGRRQWERLNSNCPTNEMGEYHCANLRPGRYLLWARNSGQLMGDNRYHGRDLRPAPAWLYKDVYYRNASTKEVATSLEIGVGTNLFGIDMQLRKVPLAPSVHIRGKVVGAPPDSDVSVGLLGGSSGPAYPPDYTFDLAAPPGEYTIRANVCAGGPKSYGIASLTVAGDMSGVVVTMSPAPEVTGRFRWAEGRGQGKLENIKVWLHFGDWEEVRSDAAGKFAFKPLAFEHYRVIVDPNTLPENCFVREIRFAGEEISPDDFAPAASGQLDVVVSNRAGKIAGTVADGEGNPFANSSVTLIPLDGKSRPAKVAVDDEGKFQFTRVRPGKYKLFAWEEIDDDLWPDPEFRQRYEHRAAAVEVGYGESQTVQLRVIAAEEMR